VTYSLVGKEDNINGECIMASQAHNDFLNHGHALAQSSWSAWYSAYRYAEEIKSSLLPLIDKGCDYAEKMKPIPTKYLNAGERLYRQAIDSLAK
jgi:hypothetical protein